MIKKSFLLLLFGLTLSSAQGVAEEILLRIEGKSEAIVQGADIHLKDIAEVSGPFAERQGIEQIVLFKQLKPGEERELAGTTILKRLTDEGISLEKVRYLLPPSIHVSREGRECPQREVQVFLNDEYRKLSSTRELGRISLLRGAPVLPVEPCEFSLTEAQERGINELLFSLSCRTTQGEEFPFQAVAKFTEYQEVPVARASLKKGTLVSEDDVEVVRIPVAGGTKNVIQNMEEIVGLETTQTVTRGAPFQKTQISQPLVVIQGQPITVRTQLGALEATAVGTALEGGAKGSWIRVRNDQSKRVIRARVIEEGLVEVIP